MRIERPRPGRARGPVLGRVDRQPSPLDLAVVKDLDRRGSLGLGGELHERESPGPPGLAIRGQVDLDDAASLGQERGQSIRGDAEGEIPDEDAGCDGWCPPVLFGVWVFWSGCAAEPLEMLAKLRGLDVLILAGHGQSVSALALVLPRRDQTGLVRGDQRGAIR